MPSSAAPHSVVVVGGGVAGFSAVRELRERGFDGAITLLSPEGLPYDRPPLSKGYLLGTEDLPKILLAPESWYEDHAVEIVAARAAAVRPADGAVELDDGTLVRAGRILLATGGTPRPLPIPGGRRAVTLRSRDDADSLRRAMVPGARIAIVGAGLIGAELASAAVELGAEATLIDPVAVPLAGAVGEVLAARLHAMHAARGVRTVLGAPTALEPLPGGSGADDAGPCLVRLGDGSSLTADAVVVGIGITPDTALAEAAGLAVDDGVLVDATGATSHPDVFAAGDACRVGQPGAVVRGRRAEHWEAAVRSGQTAAAGMLGEAPPEFGAPWFWSDRHGVHVEAVGTLASNGSSGARTILRESEGVPVAAFLVAADGHLLGCAAVDGPLIVRASRRIIDRGIVPDPERLADPSVDPRKLAR